MKQKKCFTISFLMGCIIILAGCGNTVGERALSGGAIGAGVGAGAAAATGGNLGKGALIGGIGGAAVGGLSR